MDGERKTDGRKQNHELVLRFLLTDAHEDVSVCSHKNISIKLGEYILCYIYAKMINTIIVVKHLRDQCQSVQSNN